MEQFSTFPVAGGSVGWGGLMNKGDRIIKSNYASTLLNVYEQNGVLKKRNGYTVNTGAFVLGGAYEAASTGSYPMDGTHFQLSQEVLLSGTGSGADIDFPGTAADLTIGIPVKTGTGTVTEAFKVYLFSVDGSGHPETLLATSSGSYIDPNRFSANETWLYICFNNVTLGTDHVCILLAPGSNPTSEMFSWFYSNGGGGYAPGGSRVSSYWNGSAYVDFSGVDFKFKFYYRITSQNNNSIFQYKKLLSLSEYAANINMQTTPTQGVEGWSSGFANSIGYTFFIENYATAFKIVNAPVAQYGNFNIFPEYTGTVGLKEIYALETNLILGTENYLFESSFNNWPLRIAKFTTANTKYRFCNTTFGLVICPDKNVPMVWGTTAYPISGYAD